jgi:hypothetical protein
MRCRAAVHTLSAATLADFPIDLEDIQRRSDGALDCRRYCHVKTDSVCLLQIAAR